MRLSRKIVGITVVFLLILGFGVGYTLLPRAMQPVQVQTADTPQPTEVPLESHVNRSFGYSLKYPTDWEVTEWDIVDAANLSQIPDGSIWQQTVFSGTDGRFEVLVWENSAHIPVRRWLSVFRHEDLELADVPLSSNTQVASIFAIAYTQETTARDIPLSYVFLTRGGRVYELVFERDDVVSVADPVGIPPHDIYDRVIESFLLLSDKK